ncbi:MAG: GTPase Era [Bacilli bacterium]
MKSGFVSIVGRPNAGKSTLINSIVKEKIAIISNKPQTTRNLIQGIYNEEDTQIIFVDTPGIHKPVNKLGQKLNNSAYYSMTDVDIVLYLVDASVNYGSGDAFIIDVLKNFTKPVFLVLNKIDLLTNDKILLKINEYKDLYNFAEIVPISAEKSDNINKLIEVLKSYLPENVKFFPDGEITSSSLEFRISEIVREKVFQLTDEEIPYSVTCDVTHYEEKEKIIKMDVDIIIDRESLKKIIIGKKGSKLKEIGIRSRSELETLFGKQVYLELYVRTLKKWRDKEKYLETLGFNEK